MTLEKKGDKVLLQEKQCSICKQVKPRAAFGPRRDNASGLSSECRPCKAAMQRRRYLEKKGDKVLLQSRQSRPRRPLPDAAKDAGWQLRKDIERLERLFADDRFARYRHQVAADVRGHLMYAAQVCQDLLSRIDYQQRG